MIYLGLDYGTKRIGVSVSDELGMFADPEDAIVYDSGTKMWRELLRVIQESRAGQIVVGLPKRTGGEIGPEAQKVLKFVEALKKQVSCEVETWDERFTTQEAERLMREAELSIRKRKEKKDSLSAKIMLQSYLDFKRIGNTK